MALSRFLGSKKGWSLTYCGEIHSVGNGFLSIIRIFVAQMEKMVKYIRRYDWRAFVLLWLFVCYVGSISLFTHCHTIDGNTIYHSHFYNGTADSHSHSLQQCKVIISLSIYIALAAASAALIAAPIWKVAMVVCDTIQNITHQAQQLRLLRAPPVFI